MLAYDREISDSFHDIWCLCTCVYELSVRLSVTCSFEIQKWYQKYYEQGGIELANDQSEHNMHCVTDQWGWVLSLQATATQTWCRGLLESCSRVNPSRQAPASWTTDKLPSQSFMQSHQHSITHRHTHTQDWSNSHFPDCHWSREVNDANYISRES